MIIRVSEKRWGKGSWGEEESWGGERGGCREGEKQQSKVNVGGWWVV